MQKPVLIRIVIPFLLLAFVLSQLFLYTGCANIVPPEGGARDSLPPVLVKANPPNNTRNFTTDRITFSFDEYVDLENYQQNVIVSPLPVNMPTMTRKLNTITIKLRDSVEQNTTYSFNFGNSIKDVNEGNILKDFVYTYSTGRYIDSLEFSGRVVLAETGQTDSTLTVMLYRDMDDSAVIKGRPRFITKLNAAGGFTFHNLPPGTFRVFAMKDEGSYRYLSQKQLFAFADSAIHVNSHTDSIRLYAYVADTTGNRSTGAAAPATPGRNARGETQAKRLKFSTNLSAGKQELTNKFIMTFDTKLRVFDSTKVHFSTDTTFIPVTNYSWSLDSNKRVLTLIHPWRENTLYNLILEKDFATDTLGQKLLKTDTLNFSTRSKSEYGDIKIRFRNLDLSKNPVLQFVQGDQLKYSFPLTSQQFSMNLLEPGDYGLRILNDNNKNGKWDPGIFFGKHQQPEIVKQVPRKTTTIKAGLDNQIEIVL
jgi:uncharacterized protein (DUF2141 family)